jgi:hypothetical protein
MDIVRVSLCIDGISSIPLKQILAMQPPIPTPSEQVPTQSFLLVIPLNYCWHVLAGAQSSWISLEQRAESHVGIVAS